MDNAKKILSMISKITDSSWKIGKSDKYINVVSSKLSNIPQDAFSNFFIDEQCTKKISTVEFALLTYDMNSENKEKLMESYGINTNLVNSILTIAREIEQIENLDEIENTTNGDFEFTEIFSYTDDIIKKHDDYSSLER